MAKCVVQIWFEAEGDPTGRPARWQLVETEFEDFATFCEFVDADRFIGGAILMTDRNSPRGEKIVTARRPCAFRGSAVMRCELPTWRFSEGG